MHINRKTDTENTTKKNKDNKPAEFVCFVSLCQGALCSQ